MNYKEIPNETIIEYHKRFADGEQYIEINALGEIEETERDYYWQEKAVYNHTKVIVEKYKYAPEELLYGKNGLVSLLVPLQRAYNAIKNREMEYINRITMGVLCVEDGSVDIDELCEDGTHAGKVIVYRQGANAPTFTTDDLDTRYYLESEKSVLDEMYNLAKDFMQANGGATLN